MQNSKIQGSQRSAPREIYVETGREQASLVLPFVFFSSDVGSSSLPQSETLSFPSRNEVELQYLVRNSILRKKSKNERD